MSAWERARAIAREFGTGNLLLVGLRHLVNRLVWFDVLIVVRQDRDRSRCPETPDAERLHATLVPAREYPQLLAQLDPDLVREHGLASFAEDARPDDLLLLSYVGGQLAGFTFAHDGGNVRLSPGVCLKVPEGYLYNFSAFTMPAFRGHRHQGWRHHALLHSPECSDRHGLIGYVLCNNLASRRGLKKSGYVEIGNIYELRWRDHCLAWTGWRLRRAGIRLHRPQRRDAVHGRRWNELSPSTEGSRVGANR